MSDDPISRAHSKHYKRRASKTDVWNSTSRVKEWRSSRDARAFKCESVPRR